MQTSHRAPRFIRHYQGISIGADKKSRYVWGLQNDLTYRLTGSFFTGCKHNMGCVRRSDMQTEANSHAIEFERIEKVDFLSTLYSTE